MAIQNSLSELVHHLRSGAYSTRSPSTYPPSFQPSPSMTSPSVSTPTTSHQHASPQSSSTAYPSSHGSVMNVPQARTARASLPSSTYQSSAIIHSGQSVPSEELHPLQLSPVYGNLPPGGQTFNIHPHPQSSQGPILPPFSSIQTMGAPVSQHTNVPSGYYPFMQQQQHYQPRQDHQPDPYISSSPHSSYHGSGDPNVELEYITMLQQSNFYRSPSNPMPMPYLPTHNSLAVQHTDDTASKETQYLRPFCFNCQTTEPPSWRRSTLNPGKIVCNKCGLYERIHLRARPLRFDELRQGTKITQTLGAQHKS